MDLHKFVWYQCMPKIWHRLTLRVFPQNELSALFDILTGDELQPIHFTFDDIIGFGKLDANLRREWRDETRLAADIKEVLGLELRLIQRGGRQFIDLDTRSARSLLAWLRYTLRSIEAFARRVEERREVGFVSVGFTTIR